MGCSACGQRYVRKKRSRDALVQKPVALPKPEPKPASPDSLPEKPDAKE